MMSLQDLLFDLRPGSDKYLDKTFDFEQSLEMTFAFQSKHCEVYRQFLHAYGWDFDNSLGSVLDIPFLPIETFKHHAVKSGQWKNEKIFKSSGTTGAIRSKHHVRRLTAYHRHAISLFEQQFGDLRDFLVLALLPNYLEAGDSSLVSMVTAFMERSGQKEEGFFIHDFQALQSKILAAQREGRRTLLFGVTFALMDFAKEMDLALPSDTIMIETGGMKGRGEELSRDELHQYLGAELGLTTIYSEYGMTELMSQAYTSVDGLFIPARSMHVIVKEINDPFAEVPVGKTGIIHIVDLANIDTCAFIATSDLGRQHQDGSFEVLGRLDNSDIRGCHLMYLER